jgi:2'-5' RNA ligase
MLENTSRFKRAGAIERSTVRAYHFFMAIKNTLDRYFMAILPPDDIASRVRLWQEELATKFDTKASLRSPPHITLHMPFLWKESRERELIEGLTKHFETVTPFPVELNNFGAFPPRVIFVDIKPAPQLLDCQYALTKFCRVEFDLHNSNYRDYPFHPHMTLAFRDLRKAKFPSAWEEFRGREFRSEFAVSHAGLLKHTGKEWLVYHTFSLGGE